jgi:L-ascorbate metabolism protein UlaG (beta-lactamase superfamily)
MTIIRWLGQACFLITTLMGTKILIDPPHPQVGYHITAHSIPANLVFVSHEHSDHNFRAAAESVHGLSPTFIAPLPLAKPGEDGSETTETETGTYTIGPKDPSEPTITYPVDTVSYKQISAYHDNVGGSLRGPNTITVIKTGGLRIVHMGDIGELNLAYNQLHEIGHVDVLMIPVGGFYTVDGSEAAAIVAELTPRVIIPMHYRTAVLNADLKSKLAPPDAFIRAMRGTAKIVYIRARDLKLSPKTLPATPTVYILRYQ